MVLMQGFRAVRRALHTLPAKGGAACSMAWSWPLTHMMSFPSTHNLMSGGMAKDVHITQGMLQDVVAAAHAAGMNCMGVIMYISELLRQVGQQSTCVKTHACRECAAA